MIYIVRPLLSEENVSELLEPELAAEIVCRAIFQFTPDLMIPTPDISHLNQDDYANIYEPAEDTFLLLDGLEADTEALKELRATVCLEIGSGSGCVTSFIGKILGPSVLYLCTDINPHACRSTRLTGKQNQVDIQVVNASLADPFYKRLSNKVDVILFNPPYVPTSEEEALQAQDSQNIQGSWAGGADGMQITDAFLDRAESLLSSKGRFYLVALKQNNIPKICRRMQEFYHLQGEVVLQRRAGREHLFIICFVRSPKETDEISSLIQTTSQQHINKNTRICET